jgi:hypothetical protein
VEALARAKLPVNPRLENALARIAFVRGDLAAAHRWFDAGAPEPKALDGSTVTGTVVGPDGKPMMNAVVVAWVGELHGDATRVFVDRRTIDGEIVETGAEGKFTVHQRNSTVVIAEAAGGTLRSAPIALPVASGFTLKLAPTGEVSGRIEAVVTAGIDAYARLSIGETFWTVHAPIVGAAFRVGGVPPGSYQLGAVGAAGTSKRRISSGLVTVVDSVTNKKLLWPGGRVIDVVVRGAIEPGATAWLVDADAAARFKRRDDLDVVAATSYDSTWSALFPIGSRYTDAGRQLYTPGAHHAIFVGDYKSIAACVAPRAAHDAPITCKPVEPEARAVLLEL